MSLNDNTIYVSTNLNELYSESTITQTFTNESKNSIELILTIPIYSDILISQFTIKIGENEAISKIIEKEKGKEKYSDSIAEGNTGVFSYSDDEKNLTFVIGNILPKEKIVLSTIFLQSINSYDKSYEYKMYFDFPFFMDNNGNKVIELEKQGINCKININANSALTRLIFLNFDEKLIKKNYLDNNKKCEIEYINNKAIREPCQIIFRTTDINIPKIYKQFNKNLNETSFYLHYINSYNKEINNKNEIDENKDIKYINKNDDDLNDYPSLFIFLIDQSGSMRGKSIELVKQSLIIFLHSLIPGSKFQIIGFGSFFKYYNEKPLDYIKENVQNSIKLIEEIEANLGGTNIYEPLEDIFKQNYENINMPKYIFLLTDGQVDDREKVLDLILLNRKNFIVHSLGIGNYFDKQLISKSAEYGYGIYKYINDVNDINKNIIEIVKICLKPYLSDINFEDLNKINKLIEYNKKIEFTYEDQIVDYGFIKNLKFDENLKIKMTYLLNNKLIEKILDFDNNNMIILDDGNTLSKIIVGNYLKNNYIDEKKEIKLSKKYNVLSKNTSLFAEIKREKFLFFKKTQQIKSVKFQIKDNDEEKTEGFLFKTKKKFNNIFNKMFSNKKKEIGVRSSRDSDELDSANPFSFDDLAFENKLSSYNMDNSNNKNNNIINEKEENKIEEKKFDIKNIILTQDIMEGYWEKNEETETIINKISDIYEKIKNYLNEKKIEDKLEKILFTFIMIYYIENKEKDLINDYLLILEKGKKYLKKQNLAYNIILNENNL